MRIDGYTVVWITKKNIINHYIRARHKIQSITPTLITEWFQILDSNSLWLSTGNCIVTGVDNCNSINQYILGVCHRYSLLRFKQHTVSENLYILYTVASQATFQHRSTFQIDSRVRRNTEAFACHICGFVYAGLKIHHIRITFIRHILNDRIGKHMQIIQTVTVELYREFLWFIQCEQQKISVYLRLNAFR